VWLSRFAGGCSRQFHISAKHIYTKYSYISVIKFHKTVQNFNTKTGHGQHSSKFVICVVLFVIRVVLSLIVMFYVLFMCKCVLPPGVNPIAVHKYTNINISS
jgi:hypothetical protein